MICRHCKQQTAGSPEKIAFIYTGLPVKIFKDGFSCADCARMEWLAGFERSKSFFVLSGKRALLDWWRYKDLRFTDRKTRIIAEAVAFGILSYEETGNWEIVSDTFINLNPHAYAGKVFFVHLEDALVFANLEYADTLYAWEIRKIGEVLSKNIALVMAQTI